MRTALTATLALAVLTASPPVHAASPRDALVVSTTWLAEHLQDPDLVLLHVGDKAEYDAAHLPGARYLALSDISVSDRSGSGLMLEMLATEDLKAKLEAAGISDNSRVVVYFGKDWISPTTRVIFTLDYAGLGDRTSLLDGGQSAWVREGRAVTDIVPALRTGTLSPLKVQPLVVTKEYVRENLHVPGVVVVDSRNEGFYTGERAGGGREKPHRTGHIEGARSVPFNTVAHDDLTLLSSEELKSLFEKAGVKPGDTVITYCHLGQQATATLFAARTLGYKTRLYDGSFEEWSRFPDYPVENPAAASPAATPRP